MSSYEVEGFAQETAMKVLSRPGLRLPEVQHDRCGQRAVWRWEQSGLKMSLPRYGRQFTNSGVRGQWLDAGWRADPAHQHAGAVPDPRRLGHPVRPAAQGRACRVRTGRRRLRRQAGDAGRRHRGTRRAAHRLPRETGADPAGAVRRHDYAPRHAGARAARRSGRWHPDRHGDRRPVGHGRLREPCRRRAAPWLRRERRGVSLPQQAGGRPGGPHHHGPGRRVPRL